MRKISFPVLIFAMSMVSGVVTPVHADCNVDDSRYVVHDAGTVTDTATGLMWKRCVQGVSTDDCSVGAGKLLIRADAMNSARAEEFGDFTDWRLPKIEELQSLIVDCASGPTINHIAFPNTDGVTVHSVSGGMDYSTKNWIVDFGTGEISAADDNTERQVRVVRTVK